MEGNRAVRPSMGTDLLRAEEEKEEKERAVLLLVLLL